MDFARKSGGRVASRGVRPANLGYAKLHGCGGGRHGGVDDSVDEPVGEGRKLDGETWLLAGKTRALHILIIMASYGPSYLPSYLPSL